MKNAVVVYVLLVPSHVIKKGSYNKWMVHNKKVLVFLVFLLPFAYHMNLQYKLFQPCTFSLQKLFILIIIIFLVFLLKRDLLQSFVPICKQYKNYEQCVVFFVNNELCIFEQENQSLWISMKVFLSKLTGFSFFRSFKLWCGSSLLCYFLLAT